MQRQVAWHDGEIELRVNEMVDTHINEERRQQYQKERFDPTTGSSSLPTICLNGIRYLLIDANGAKLLNKQSC